MTHEHVFLYQIPPDEGGQLVCDCGVFKWQWFAEIVPRLMAALKELESSWTYADGSAGGGCYSENPKGVICRFCKKRTPGYERRKNGIQHEPDCVTRLV